METGSDHYSAPPSLSDRSCNLGSPGRKQPVKSQGTPFLKKSGRALLAFAVGFKRVS